VALAFGVDPTVPSAAPATLALDEAAQSACKPASPDHADCLALKARGLSHTRASMTIARKLARRCFHTLRELDSNALTPVN
jgi:transposase